MTVKEETRNRTVVVYSSFRSSSTWFWTRMRMCASFRCYYEVFNEMLSSVSPADICTINPSSWRSRHPKAEGYQIEYLPLIDECGVSSFPFHEISSDQFIGHEGTGGDLEGEIEHYLRGLTSFAKEQGQVPVLSCTRILGRSSGIRRSFPGFHIMIVRNVFQQWASYSGQHRTGNPYFMETLFATLSLSSRAPYIAYLSSFFDEERKSCFDRWIDEDNYDMVFCYFIAWHIYLFLTARPNMDLVIDVNALSDPSGGYRGWAEHEIATGTGHHIDLSGATNAIDYPKFVVASPDECRYIVEAMVEKAHAMLSSSPEDRDFARKILDEAWAEMDRFTFYTESTGEIIATQAGDIRNHHARELAVQSELAGKEEETRRVVSGLEECLAQAREQEEALRSVLEVERAGSLGLRDALARREGEGAVLEAEAAALREEVAVLPELRDDRDRAMEELAIARSEVCREQQDKATIASALAALQADLAESWLLLEHERTEHGRLSAERARLYDELALESGPTALRAVLPFARMVRALAAFGGQIGRTLRPRPRP